MFVSYIFSVSFFKFPSHSEATYTVHSSIVHAVYSQMDFIS